MSYEETIRLVFRLAVERINQHMKLEGVKDEYELLGFNSKIDYELSTREWDDKKIKNILQGDVEKNDNRFLLTHDYAGLFKRSLNFKTYHELYWGTNEEFDAYCQELFFCLLNDMKKDSNNAKIQEIVSSVCQGPQ